MRGDFDAVLVLGNQVLSLNPKFKDPYSTVKAFSNKAFAEIELGQLMEAKANIAEGMRVNDENGIDALQGELLHVAGSLAFLEGKSIEASRLYSQSISFAQQLDQMSYILLNLINMAQIAICDTDADVFSVVEWLSAVQIEARRVGYHLPLSYQTRMAEILGNAATQLDDAALASAQMQGSAMTLSATIVLAQTTLDKLISEAEADVNPTSVYGAFG